MSYNYYNLSHLPLLPENVVNEALYTEYVYSKSPNTIRAIAEAFKETNFYKDLERTFGNCYAHYLKNPPFMLYDWHIDNKRFCGLNWVIKTNSNANTFFRHLYDGDDYGRELLAMKVSPLIWKLENVNYVLQKPTLLRTTNQHCVINNSDEERIILTVAVNHVPYEEMLHYLKNLNIDQY